MNTLFGHLKSGKDEITATIVVKDIRLTMLPMSGAKGGAPVLVGAAATAASSLGHSGGTPNASHSHHSGLDNPTSSSSARNSIGNNAASTSPSLTPPPQQHHHQFHHQSSNDDKFSGVTAHHQMAASVSQASNHSNSYTHYAVSLERKGKADSARRTRWMNTEYVVRDPKKCAALLDGTAAAAAEGGGGASQDIFPLFVGTEEEQAAASLSRSPTLMASLGMRGGDANDNSHAASLVDLSGGANNSNSYEPVTSELVWSLLNAMTFHVNFKTETSEETPTKADEKKEKEKVKEKKEKKDGNKNEIEKIVEAFASPAANESTSVVHDASGGKASHSASAAASSSANAAFWETVGLPENTVAKSKTTHPLIASVHCFNIHQALDDYMASLRDAAPMPTPSNPKKPFWGAKETIVPCKDFKIDLAQCVNSATKESKHQIPVNLPGLVASKEVAKKEKKEEKEREKEDKREKKEREREEKEKKEKGKEEKKEKKDKKDKEGKDKDKKDKDGKASTDETKDSSTPSDDTLDNNNINNNSPSPNPVRNSPLIAAAATPASTTPSQQTAMRDASVSASPHATAKYVTGQPQNCFLEITLCCIGVSRLGEEFHEKEAADKEREEGKDDKESLQAPTDKSEEGKKKKNDEEEETKEDEEESRRKEEAEREQKALEEADEKHKRALALNTTLPNASLVSGIDFSKLNPKDPIHHYFFSKLPHLFAKQFKPWYHEYCIVIDAVHLDVTNNPLLRGGPLSASSATKPEKEIQKFGFGFFIDVSNGTPGSKMEHVCKALKAPEDGDVVARRVKNNNKNSAAFNSSGLYYNTVSADNTHNNNNGGVSKSLFGNSTSSGAGGGAASFFSGRKIVDFSTIPVPSSTIESGEGGITRKGPKEREASWVVCSSDSQHYSNIAVGSRVMCTSRFRADVVRDGGLCHSSQKAQLSFGIIRVDGRSEYSTTVAWTQPIDLAAEVINVENYPDEGMVFSASFVDGGERVYFRLRRRCFVDPLLHMSPLLEPTPFFADVKDEEDEDKARSPAGTALDKAVPGGADSPSVSLGQAITEAAMASRQPSMQNKYKHEEGATIVVGDLNQQQQKDEGDATADDGTATYDNSSIASDRPPAILNQELQGGFAGGGYSGNAYRYLQAAAHAAVEQDGLYGDDSSEASIPPPKRKS